MFCWYAIKDRADLHILFAFVHGLSDLESNEDCDYKRLCT